MSRPLVDACCQPDPAEDEHEPAHRRGRLSDLDVNMHCSVLGTCLSTTALRGIMQRLVPADDARRASDLEVHHAAVELAGQPGKATKILHKALDEKHAVTLKRFDQANGAERLGELWREALESGDVPGAYWAVMTHADATPQLRRRAFGDVHMLSHLVGAANRADLRRLAALQQQETDLKSRLDRQQERLQQLGGERDALQRQLAALQIDNDALRTAAAQAESKSDIDGLRQSLQERDRLVALQTSRREAAEREAAYAVGESATRTEELAIARRMLDALSQEVSALEREVAGDDAASAAKPSLKSILEGRRVVYVGGRPSTSSAIRALVERSGGELISHDGGMEQRKGQFVASLPGADVVMFPVDCVDHDSVLLLKRQCERHGVPYRALRSASIASFAAAVVEMAPAPDQSGSPATRFCIRHA